MAASLGAARPRHAPSRNAGALAVLAVACVLLTAGSWQSGAFVPGAENMPEGTPKLYGYDHSHYTVRCRMALGLKKVPYRMVFIAEDDAETPMKLVGKKVTPIMEWPGEPAMPESGDIIARVDNDEAFGPPLLKPKTDRHDLDAWVKRISVPMRNLGRPRYIRPSMLPEFCSRSARDRFVTTHPLPDPVTGETKSKADWALLPKEERDRVYNHYWEQSEGLLKQLNAELKGIEGMIAADEHVSSHGISWDDIVFFSRVRGLTLIKGLDLPPSLKAYLETMSEATDVPLLTSMATDVRMAHCVACSRWLLSMQPQVPD